MFPASISELLHNQKRIYWPNNCNEAINLLQDKNKLTKLTPIYWKNEFTSIYNPNGFIIKPKKGYASIDVIHFIVKKKKRDKPSFR